MFLLNIAVLRQKSIFTKTFCSVWCLQDNYRPTFAADSDTMIDMRLFQLFLFLFWVHWATVAQAQDRYVPHQLLVALVPGASPSDFLPLQEDVNEHKWVTIRKVTSHAANIWLLELDSPNMDVSNAEKWIKNQPTVLEVQLNHYVQQRTSPDVSLPELKLAYPNDPLFAIQWQMENTGQMNGTPGVDLGMIDAWDITTGGVSPTGDTVVVAVIDGGICPSCPDWGNNIW